MIRIVCVCGVLAMTAAPARAEESVDTHLDRARELYTKENFTGARDELLAAYQLDARPELLFALGQIEFRLKHYRAAIDYYQRFTATNPDAAQAALAEQAIGAARMELARPVPEPPKPKPVVHLHREFDTTDSALALTGVVLVAGSGIAFYEMVHQSNDRSGTLADYDHRVTMAKNARVVGVATAAVGAIAIAASVWRWRTHMIETRVEVRASATGASVSLGRTW